MRFSLSCLTTLLLVAGLTTCVLALPVTNLELVHGDSPAERGNHLVRRTHQEDLTNLLQLYKAGGCLANSNNLKHAGWQFDPESDKWVKKAAGDFKLTLAEIGQREFALACQKEFRAGYLSELVQLFRAGGGRAAVQAGWQLHNSQQPYYWTKMAQGAPQFELARILHDDAVAAAKQGPR